MPGRYTVLASGKPAASFRGLYTLIAFARLDPHPHQPCGHERPATAEHHTPSEEGRTQSPSRARTRPEEHVPRNGAILVQTASRTHLLGTPPFGGAYSSLAPRPHALRVRVRSPIRAHGPALNFCVWRFRGITLKPTTRTRGQLLSWFEVGCSSCYSWNVKFALLVLRVQGRRRHLVCHLPHPSTPPSRTCCCSAKTSTAHGQIMNLASTPMYVWSTGSAAISLTTSITGWLPDNGFRSWTRHPRRTRSATRRDFGPCHAPSRSTPPRPLPTRPAKTRQRAWRAALGLPQRRPGPVRHERLGNQRGQGSSGARAREPVV